MLVRLDHVEIGSLASGHPIVAIELQLGSDDGVLTDIHENGRADSAGATGSTREQVLPRGSVLSIGMSRGRIREVEPLLAEHGGRSLIHER